MPNLAAKEHCTGCTACASVCPKGCISMTADENDFLCPVVDADKCVACGLCEKICPVAHPVTISQNQPQAYAAYSKDEAMRLESSSGGLFTELARAVLKDCGAVFGAAYNQRFEVVHICVENEADLAKLRGAKYAQSDLRGIFADVKCCLEKGKKVLFSGTPCQVGGLKAYLKKDYPNLISVDFVCHGVPSPMAWREYVKYRAEQDNGGQFPDSINLRSKKTGWTNYQYSNLFAYPDGHAHVSKSGESLYMKLFVGDYISRESCAHCQFKGYGRISDLTIGDFWGIWDIDSEMDDNKGTSVVLVQSQRGAELLQSITDQLVLKPVTLEETSRHNSAMLLCAKTNTLRKRMLKTIRRGHIAACPTILEVSKNKLVRMLGHCLKAVPPFLKKPHNET